MNKASKTVVDKTNERHLFVQKRESIITEKNRQMKSEKNGIIVHVIFVGIKNTVMFVVE